MFEPDNLFADLIPQQPTSAGSVTVGKPRAPEGPKTTQVGGQFGVVGQDGSFTPTYTAPEKPDKPKEAREFEAQSAAYYGRMVASQKAYGDGILARDPVSQTFYDFTPKNFKNSVNDPVQRAALDYATDFIRAKLRKESGAVIGDEEMASEYRLYFPVPNDTPEDLKRKATMREQAINGMAAAAGDEAGKLKIVDYPALSTFMEQRQPTEAPAQPLNAVALGSGRRSYTLDDLPPVPGRLPTEDEAGMPQQALLTPPPGEVFVRWNTRDGVSRPTFGPPQARGDETNGLVNRADAAVRGAADTLTFGLADKAAAVGDTIFKGGTFNENLIRQNAVDENDNENLFGYRLTGQLAGGLALPSFGARSITEMGALGGAYGAAYGAGSQDQLSGVPLGALSGGVLGTAAGGVGGALVNKVAPGLGALSQRLRGSNVDEVAAKQSIPLDIARASAEENVPLIKPMYDDAAAGQRRALASRNGSGEIIREGEAVPEGAIEARLRSLAPGEAMEPENAGGVIQGAAKRFLAQSKVRPQRWYARAEAMEPTAKIEPQDGLAVVDRRLAELRENPSSNKEEIAYFDDLRADLTQPGGKSIASLRSLREDLRSRLSQKNLTRTRAEAVALEAMAAIRSDVAKQAPRAARAYEVADRLWSERMEAINDFVKPFVGSETNRVAGKAAFDQFKALINGKDGRRLRGMWSNLEGQEAADVAATLIAPLGRDAVDGPFSASRFLTQTKNMSPSALETAFGPSGARSIKNLRILARGLNNARNAASPGTGVGRTVLTDMGTVAGASAVAGVGGAAAIGATGGAAALLPIVGAAVSRWMQRAQARSLMSPRLTQFLSDLPNVRTRGDLRTQTEKLGRLMGREPVIANDVAPLHQELSKLWAGKAAASEPEEGKPDERQ